MFLAKKLVVVLMSLNIKCHVVPHLVNLTSILEPSIGIEMASLLDSLHHLEKYSLVSIIRQCRLTYNGFES